MLLPSSASKNKQSEVQARKQVESRTSILKIEAISSCKTLVEFQRTTRRYIPEDSTPPNHPSDNLKPCVLRQLFIIVLNMHSRKMPEWYCKLGHDRFLPQSYPLIITDSVTRRHSQLIAEASCVSVLQIRGGGD
jgi:hypothetical protein